MRLVVILAWELVCLVGFVYSWRNRARAIDDERWLARINLNGVYRVQADGNVRRDTTRLVFWTIFGLVGIVAAVTPTHAMLRPVDLIVSLALVVGSALNAWNSVMDNRDRQETRRLAERAAEERRG